MTSTSPLSRDAIVRIAMDILSAELTRSRQRPAAALGRATWTEATRVDESGLDLDSLERLDVSAALNEFFHLHEYGAEDYLLAQASVGEWCDLIEQSLDATGTHLTFRTSGSTGEPKRCTHAIADLQAEAVAWTRHLNNIAGVAALVPAHHIYGAIFTALLPDTLGIGCPVVMGAGAAGVRSAPPRTLVVATPTQWTYLATALLVFPLGLTGVTSTALMPSQLAHRLRGQRLERLLEIYGSSETGGVAMREHEAAAFALLEGWSVEPGRGILRTRANGSRAVLEAPDHLRWLDETHFVIEGRRDGAVQVGGVNVFPERVRDALLAHAGVSEAAVRLEQDTGRLKAFVVPVADTDQASLIPALDRWCGDRLSSVERPRQFALGVALPVNAMGKLTDW